MKNHKNNLIFCTIVLVLLFLATIRFVYFGEVNEKSFKTICTLLPMVIFTCFIIIIGSLSKCFKSNTKEMPILSDAEKKCIDEQTQKLIKDYYKSQKK